MEININIFSYRRIILSLHQRHFLLGACAKGLCLVILVQRLENEITDRAFSDLAMYPMRRLFLLILAIAIGSICLILFASSFQKEIQPEENKNKWLPSETEAASNQTDVSLKYTQLLICQSFVKILNFAKEYFILKNLFVSFSLLDF